MRGKREARNDEPTPKVRATVSPNAAGVSGLDEPAPSKDSRSFQLSMESIQRLRLSQSIAQYSMDELLDMLDAVLRNNNPTADVSRLAVTIAQRAGARQLRPSALTAVLAACRYLRSPHEYATPAQAATKCGCNIRTCEQWVDKIEACLLAEASTAAATTTAPTGQGSSSDQAREAPVACSPDEVAAVDSLVSLGDGRHRAGP